MSTHAHLLRRIVIVVTLILSLSAAMPFAGAAQPADNGGPGNSGAAKQCQNGNWTHLARAEDNSIAFTNQDECVSYAAQGGTIVDWDASDPRCAGDGFYTWRTSDRGRFTSSEECNTYVAGGGTLAHEPSIEYGFRRVSPQVLRCHADVSISLLIPGESYSATTFVQRDNYEPLDQTFVAPSTGIFTYTYPITAQVGVVTDTYLYDASGNLLAHEESEFAC